MEARCNNLTYRLICIPDTAALEHLVNEALKENKDKYLIAEKFTTTPYYKRKKISKCPKCGSEIKQARDGDYRCISCRTAYTEAEFTKYSELVIEPAGVFFIQQLIFEDREER